MGVHFTVCLQGFEKLEPRLDQGPTYAPIGCVEIYRAPYELVATFQSCDPDELRRLAETALLAAERLEAALLEGLPTREADNHV